METFIVKLAVAVVPLVALVAIVIMADSHSGRRKTPAKVNLTVTRYQGARS